MFDDLKPHIAELRKRLAYSIGALFVAFFVAFYFYEPILEWMTLPLKEVLPDDSYMIATGVPEVFFTAVKVSLFSGFLLALPFILYQFWLFIAPGLYEHEKKYVWPFVFFASGMFFLGAAFAYYIVVPYGFAFLVNFAEQIVTVAPKINEYVGFFTKIMIGFGIAFELPVITLFLALLGLVDDHTLKSFFKYAIILIFVLAALLTPPDVVTQLLMAIPLIILYGVSILIAKIVNPYKPLDDEEEETE
ncbi:twin-arginine translocase subunit TatC [Hydrogenimonas thermophila]|uniref:Sec-independent protein translocase protein TatC n=1 Tax=Hydrogenimonas thermophila TaxID=223786 RepID=A0A1I5MLL8_9BACT|nr:twin-arginine translocase subunit TatC [Hydrogenimonas thermophila]WOE70948.1 twin-arginine translocase subunit TatC [Hydrogenimonas thermophila]WOE73466.1 twin-arginine translocase subunit TatC [Hydrogenimonas thermophila]SFP10488.1 Sec-independent protein translocase TatC [Hydrogenimonas thermophila]